MGQFGQMLLNGAKVEANGLCVIFFHPNLTWAGLVTKLSFHPVEAGRRARAVQMAAAQLASNFTLMPNNAISCA